MVTVSVRPFIAGGGELSGAIMAAVAALAGHEKLAVLAPSGPVPPAGVLGSQGFSCEAAGLGDGGWQVTFGRGS